MIADCAGVEVIDLGTIEIDHLDRIFPAQINELSVCEGGLPLAHDLCKISQRPPSALITADRQYFRKADTVVSNRVVKRVLRIRIVRRRKHIHDAKALLLDHPLEPSMHIRTGTLTKDFLHFVGLLVCGGFKTESNRRDPDPLRWWWIGLAMPAPPSRPWPSAWPVRASTRPQHPRRSIAISAPRRFPASFCRAPKPRRRSRASTIRAARFRQST